LREQVQKDEAAASVGKSRAAVLRRRERRRSFLCERQRSRRVDRAIARAALKKMGITST